MARQFFRYITLLALGIILGSLMTIVFFPTRVVERTVEIPVQVPVTLVNRVQLYVPGVSLQGQGIMLPITVQAQQGTGKVLADIEGLLFVVDTQHSIKTAHGVAGTVTGLDLSKYDVIYSAKITNVSVVGGESAGAALTILTIAALTNQTLKPGVTITGSIDENGTIHQIGAAAIKASAAHDFGFKTLLVPLNQSTDEAILSKETCETTDGTKICRNKNIKVTPKDLIDEVIEVKDIKEAAVYFGLKL